MFARTDPVITKPPVVLADTNPRIRAPIAVALAAEIVQIGAAVNVDAKETVHVSVAEAPILIVPALVRLPATIVPLVPVPQAPDAIVGTEPVPILTTPLVEPTVKSPEAVLIAGTVKVPVNVGLVANPGLG